MSKYSFYLYYADATTKTYPHLEFIEATDRDEAIQAFCRKYQLTVDSDEGNAVWFIGRDGEALRYSVEERE
jgi:hypothetical protein